MIEFIEDESYYLVRRHPLKGFTYVKGYANNVDSEGFEVVPDVSESNAMFDTITQAKEMAEQEGSMYGVFLHEECCTGHIFEGISCVDCDKEFIICLECDYDERHRC
ncbi:MAG: hypothetical protein ACKOW9_06490 [Candidatus Paceibacterota bacterium]